MNIENELKQEKINRVAIGIAYYLLTPLIAQEHDNVSITDFESGNKDITDYVDVEFWNDLVNNLKGKLTKYDKASPKGFYELSKSYILR